MAHIEAKEKISHTDDVLKAGLAVTAASAMSPFGIIPFVLGGMGVLGALSVKDDGALLRKIREEITLAQETNNIQKKVSFFQELWGSLRVIAGLEPETIAETFGVTKPGVLNWEIKSTDSETGEQIFKAKINAFQYHSLLELLTFENWQHPENGHLTIVLKILMELTLNPNAYTEQEREEIKNLIVSLAEYKDIVSKYPNAAVKLDESVTQKLMSYSKRHGVRTIGGQETDRERGDD